jgi:hypothetical protein
MWMAKLVCRCMRRTRPHYVLLLTLLCVASARAQSRDWKVVEQLAPGTPISVKYGRFWIHNRCVFESATDETLVCERTLYGYSRLFIPPVAAYRQKLVREVRLEHSDASNITFGAVIGGAVGGALGAAGSGDTHAQVRVGLGLLVGVGGAAIGGLIGRDFPILHGRVIYRR